jgi:hypothetical protein
MVTESGSWMNIFGFDGAGGFEDCYCWTLTDRRETKSGALKSDSVTNRKAMVFHFDYQYIQNP